MTRHGQLDLFGESQPELPGTERTAAVVRADPDKAPAELLRVLTKVRAARSFPWDARRVGLLRLISARLPDERWRRRDGRPAFGAAGERQPRRRQRRSEAISKPPPLSLAMSTVSVRSDTRM